MSGLRRSIGLFRATAFVLSTIVIVAQQIVAQPFESAAGLGLVVAGLPIHYFWVAPQTRRAAT